MRLSMPVPPHAFAGRYGRGADPGCLNQLALGGKERLFLLTASSGSLANVATLVERMEPPFWWKAPKQPKPGVWRDACAAAARNRHMHVVRWLLQHGYPLDAEAVVAAVMRHCDLADVQWLLAQGPVRRSPGFASGRLPESVVSAVGSTATADAPEKLDWFYSENGAHCLWTAVALGAAEGDNLPALEWALQRSTAREARALQGDVFKTAAENGATNVTAWLLRRGVPASCARHAASYAAGKGQTAVLRLLVSHALDQEDGDDEQDAEFLIDCLQSTASSGCLEALQYVWELAAGDGVEVGDADFDNAVRSAVGSGNTEAVRWLLQQRGYRAIPVADTGSNTFLVTTAVAIGSIPMLGLVCDMAGAAWDRADAMRYAALHSRAPGGVLPLLQCLHERGCPLECGSGWHSYSAAFDDNAAVLRWLYDKGLVRQQDIARAGVLEQAAASGCVAAAEWIASLQCRAGRGGQPYIAAGRNGDLDMLRCLKRLGVPWGPDTVLQAVQRGLPAHVVRWMVGEGGAPCDRRAVLSVGNRYSVQEGAGLRDWLRSAVQFPGEGSGLRMDSRRSQSAARK